ncbi:MAG: hypothetical protein AAF892_08645 [Cyanobacteria bacterium P01_D01_bin.71]
MLSFYEVKFLGCAIEQNQNALEMGIAASASQKPAKEQLGFQHEEVTVNNDDSPWFLTNEMNELPWQKLGQR